MWHLSKWSIFQSRLKACLHRQAIYSLFIFFFHSSLLISLILPLWSKTLSLQKRCSCGARSSAAAQSRLACYPERMLIFFFFTILDSILPWNAIWDFLDNPWYEILPGPPKILLPYIYIFMFTYTQLLI